MESHPLFGEVAGLMEEVSIARADMAELLMHKTLEASDSGRADACLKNLVDATAELKGERT